jgi:hypothetical protein
MNLLIAPKLFGKVYIWREAPRSPQSSTGCSLVQEALAWWLAEDIYKGTRWVTALTRLRAMQAEGFSLRTIANQLNAEGIPMLGGEEQWQKGTIENLLA